MPGARAIEIPVGAARLKGTLTWPRHPSGFVVCVRARGGGHAALEERRLGLELRAEGLGTLLLDRPIGHRARDLKLRAERVVAVTEWLAEQPECAGLPLGCLGTGAGAEAALGAAGSSTWLAPTLLIVGERDEEGLRLPRPALVRLGGRKWMTSIPGAGRLFEEPGTLAEVGRRAALWFVRYLAMEPAWRAAHAVSETTPSLR